MTQMDEVIRSLKALPEPKPYGLDRGLTLKYSRMGGGLEQIILYRGQGVAPGLNEVAVIVEAVKRIDDPVIVIHGELEGAGGERPYYRVWWWTDGVVVSWLRPPAKQLALI